MKLFYYMNHAATTDKIASIGRRVMLWIHFVSGAGNTVMNCVLIVCRLIRGLALFNIAYAPFCCFLQDKSCSGENMVSYCVERITFQKLLLLEPDCMLLCLLVMYRYVSGA
jgi:hypothetical protein